MAWNQLNSSFNAITDRLSVITSSVLSNETTDTNESADSEYAQQLRVLETEKNVFQKEALRLEAEINKYRTRWLHAEESLQRVTGSRSEVYEDEVDLSDSLAANEVRTASPSQTVEATDEVSLPSETNVGLASAVAEIHRLQDELHKVNADREHWRQLAKHKTSANASIEEQLDNSRLKIKELELTLSQLQSENSTLRNELAASVENLQSEKSALESSLVELDDEHQKEISKIISVKNELVKSNLELVSKYDSLYNSYCKYEQENAALVSELQNLRKESITKEFDGESFSISSSTDVLRVADRQEPEGAPISSDEPVSHANVESDLFEAKVNASLQSLQLVVQEKDNVIKRSESKSRQFELEVEQLKLQLEANLHNISKLECELKCANDALAEEQRLRKAAEQLCANERNAEQTLDSGSININSAECELSRNNGEIVASHQTVDSLHSPSAETTENGSRLGNENNSAHLFNENEKLSAELERLRKHLVEIEENYTQELLVASEREKEVTSELQAAKQLIDKLRKQLANDEKLQKLKEQLKKLSMERDKALEEVSQLDDKLQKSSAAVSNLQLVIEQIQKENEWRLEQREKQYEERLANEKTECNELKRNLRWYEEKHLESKNALDAAARLAEQIDVKEATIKNLKTEIANNRTLTDKLVADINELKNSFEGKVDKQIIKSLVLGYFNTPHDKKHEVQRLLARFLDFNQEEMQKAGLQVGKHERSKFGSGNWSSLVQTEGHQQSLAKAFVQFLENESTNPKVHVHELAKGFTDVVSAHKSTSRRPSATPSTQSTDNQLLSEQTITNLSSIQPMFIPTSKS